MATWQAVLVGAGAIAALYAAFVGLLLAAGRNTDARALAGFVPDCVALLAGLLRDPRVPRRRKWAVAALLAYLATPIDLVPDFIPVAGQLDDAVAVALVLRWLVRGGPGLVRDHWRGPLRSLELVLRLAYGQRPCSSK